MLLVYGLGFGGTGALADTSASTVRTQAVMPGQQYPGVDAHSEGWFDVGGFCKVVDVGDLSWMNPPAKGIPVFIPGPAAQWENYRSVAPTHYNGQLVLTTCCRAQANIATLCASAYNPTPVSRQYGRLGEVDTVAVTCQGANGQYVESANFACTGDNGPDGQANWAQSGADTDVCAPNAQTLLGACTAPGNCGRGMQSVTKLDSCGRTQSVTTQACDTGVSCCTPTPGSCTGSCGGGVGVDSCGNACVNTQACGCSALATDWTGTSSSGNMLVCGGNLPATPSGQTASLTSTPTTPPNAPMTNALVSNPGAQEGYGSGAYYCDPTSKSWAVLGNSLNCQQYGNYNACPGGSTAVWTDPTTGLGCVGSLPATTQHAGDVANVTAIPGSTTGSARYICEPGSYGPGTTGGWVLAPGTAACHASGACNPSSIANGTVSPYPACQISCNAGYTLSGSSCVGQAQICNPSSVANGIVEPWPNCAIVCNSGYTLSGGYCLSQGGSTCNPSSVANGSVAAYPNCAITCNPGYTLSGTSCVPSGPTYCAPGTTISKCSLWPGYICTDKYTNQPITSPVYSDCGGECQRIGQLGGAPSTWPDAGGTFTQPNCTCQNGSSPSCQTAEGPTCYVCN